MKRSLRRELRVREVLQGNLEDRRRTRTEEGDGVAQLAAPRSSRLGVQLVQALHDVSVADVTVPHEALKTRAPEGHSGLGDSS